MSRRDQLSGKGPLVGNIRSHAMNATKRKFNVNLQKITITSSNGTPTTLRVSAKTIKTLKRKGILASAQ
ncbi:50S ribosomal protein L28 [Mycoplasmopsis felifaucium]|uniref:Large ribosomal subunit protein bL28 n=1 Tax=Mycoplasmopsis felifaucium TaxID=35768 RepID=A0ABZ2RU11_9BACT|nr:50S ribosomal protein L28 [Mycoplasmopsis felifaucium]